jgi:hypothetical protein
VEPKAGGRLKSISRLEHKTLLAGEHLARYMIGTACRRSTISLARPEVESERTGYTG